MIGILTKNTDFFLRHRIQEGDACLFFDGYIPPMVADNLTKFSVASIYEFNGIGVSTCISTTQKLMGTSTLSKKILLLEDPCWTRLSRFRYVDLVNIFINDDIKIVSLNEETDNIVTNMFRKPDALMKEFDLNLLENL